MTIIDKVKSGHSVAQYMTRNPTIIELDKKTLSGIRMALESVVKSGQ